MHDERTCPPRQPGRFQRYRRNRRHAFASPPHLHPIIRLLLIALLFLHATVSPASAFAPADSVALQRLGLQSPTAASLGVYGDIPVNLYTGVPNISLPLYNLRGRSLSVPISISYHASGNKVEEIASWIGLGWSLNAGGVITRTLRGLPDEDEDGYSNTGGDLEDELPDPSQQYKDDVNNENKDSEPDQFFYNFLGRSGKFVWGPNDDIRSIPYEKIQFEWLGSDKWKVTTEDGTRYFFEDAESTTDATSVEGVIRDRPDLSYKSSWFLTRIESAAGDDEIRFNYGTISGVTYQIRQYQEILHPRFVLAGNCPGVPDDTLRIYNNSTTTVKYLTSIVSDFDSVAFATATRQDVGAEKRYSSFTVYSNGSLQRKVIFGNDAYFLDPQSNSSRLKLESVQIDDGSGNKLPATTFTYNASKLPPRTSSAIDAWGYYNGKTKNTTLIPEHVGRVLDKETFLPGADRHPFADSAMAGILKKITYPTGGHSELSYEGHDYGYIDAGAISDAEFLFTENLRAEAGDADSVEITFDDNLNDKIGIEIEVILDGQSGKPARVRFLNITADPDRVLFDYQQEASFDTTERIVVYADSTYRLIAISDDLGSVARADARWYESRSSKIRRAGGLRIKKVVHHDGIDAANDVVLQYNYRTTADTARSSGSVINEPKFANIQGGSTQDCHISRASGTRIPLGVTHGSPVGYSEVTIIYGENGENGKSVHQFLSPRDYNDFIPPTPYNSPLFAQTSVEWKRGHLTQKHDFNAQNSLLQRLEKSYVFKDEDQSDTTTTKRFAGLSLKMIEEVVIGGTPTKIYTLQDYEVIASWTYPDSEIVTYFPAGDADSLQTTTAYFYESTVHLQLSKIFETNSDNSRRVTRLRYPADFDDASASGDDAVKALHYMTDSLHIHNAVVERLVYGKKSGENTKVHSAELTTFKDFSSSGPRQVLPHQRLVYRRDTLEDSTAFDLASVDTNASPDSVKYDGDYVIVQTFNSYDAYGRPLQTTDARGTPSAMLWSGLVPAPRAAFVNTQKDRSFVDSFDDGDVSDWSSDYTGPSATSDGVRGTVMRLQNTTSTQNAYKTMLATGLQNGVFEYDIKLGQTNKNHRNILKAANGNTGPWITWTESGTISYRHNGIDYSLGETYSDNKWYHVRIEFSRDVDVDSYDLYIDGRKIGTELPFNQITASLTRAHFETVSTSAANVYLDQVRFYPRSALAVSAAFDPRHGTVAAVTNENGNHTFFRHDPFGRLTTIFDTNADTLQRITYTYGRDLTGDDSFSSAKPNHIQTLAFREATATDTTRTYFDGLGRHIQSVQFDAANSIKIATVYDSLGRPWKVTKPFESDSTSYTTNPITAANDFYDDIYAYDDGTTTVNDAGDYAYAETKYLPEPLNRIHKQGAPGTTYRIGAATERVATFDYRLNSSGDVSGYSANTLLKQRRRDENGITVDTFTDLFGNTIATTVDSADSSYTTLFEYDVPGNLLKSTDPRQNDTLSVHYAYTTLNQLRFKKAPDADTVRYLYDKTGNLRFVEDGKGKDESHFIYYNYDVFNRVIEEGIVRNNQAAFTQANADVPTFPTSNDSAHFRIKYHYDTQGYAPGKTPRYLAGRLDAIEYTTPHFPQTNGYMFYSYDEKGNVEWLIQYVPTGDGNSLAISIDYDQIDRLGNLQKMHSYRRFPPGASRDDFYVWYTYDDLGRLHKVLSNTIDSEPATADAEYIYYPTGQVNRLALGDSVQGVDYLYNSRDWLTQINHHGLATSKDPGGDGGGGSTFYTDRFGQIIGYDRHAEIVADADQHELDFVAQYNGNIAWITLGTTDNDNPAVQTGWVFKYDNLYRLTKANWGYYTNDWVASNKYDIPAMLYDKAGNIKQMQRRDEVQSLTTMNYTLIPKTNQLDWVQNLHGQSSGNYSYDANGNMIKDIAKLGSGSTITYDYRNLPLTVPIGANTIRFGYDGAGQRVFKNDIYYVRDAQGRPLAGYHRDGTHLYWNLWGLDLIGQKFWKQN